MNELWNDARFWFTAMGLGILGLVKLLWAKQERRLSQLEADAVRKTEFEQFRSDLRREHGENQSVLRDIKMLIERNHENTVESRHAMANQILTLVEKVGTIQGQLGIEEFRRRES